MALVWKPDPLTPDQQVDAWLHDGATLERLAARIRTPAIRAVILARLQAKVEEEKQPRQSVTQAAIVGGS